MLAEPVERWRKEFQTTVKDMVAGPPLIVAAPSSASSALVADASLPLGMGNENEDNNSNIFALLMPNLYGKLQLYDETVSEQELQEIQRLLNPSTSENEEMKDGLVTHQPSEFLKQKDKEHGIGVEEIKEKDSELVKSVHSSGKENILSTNEFPQRNKISRRERSSRITTHRKPFVVDIRSFGSLLNSNALGQCKKPQDVHAFWDAADEREASEAIMSKLRGRTEPCSQKNETDKLISRRLAMRRKNSHRTTTRLRRFVVELPSCVDQVQSLDEMQLEEEEEDGTEESSFTFLSNPEFKAQSHLYEKYNPAKDINVDQSVALLLEKYNENEEDYRKNTSLAVMHIGKDPEEDDIEILSDGNCPPVNLEDTNQRGLGETDFAASRCGSGECEKESESSAMEIAPVDQASQPETDPAIIPQDRHLVPETNIAHEPFVKATPYNRRIAARRTPCTSPTPPSNPLAVFGLGKDNVVEDVSKRRLDFDDTNEPPSLEVELPASTVEDTRGSQNSNADVSEKEAEENNLDSVKEMAFSSVLRSKSPEKNMTKPLRKVSRKRKKPLEDRRNSLAGAGTKLDNGMRRSTRIRSRPLEWWRGERFLVGRVHNSLTTVIGIKYSSPPPCWPKRGFKPPPFKVESYVSEKYAKIIQFAAL